MPDKILVSPDPPAQDVSTACVRAVVDIPNLLVDINNALCDIAAYVSVCALCMRRSAQAQGHLTESDIKELDNAG